MFKIDFFQVVTPETLNRTGIKMVTYRQWR